MAATWTFLPLAQQRIDQTTGSFRLIALDQDVPRLQHAARGDNESVGLKIEGQTLPPVLTVQPDL
jgi:hypothetical protein